MTRIQVLVGALVAVLVVALFVVFAVQPLLEEREEVEERLAQEEATQEQLSTDIDRLRTVRTQAPEVEAEVLTGETMVPRHTALPPLLRQLQTAADESNVELTSVATTRPAPVDEGPVDGLVEIDLTAQLSGPYFAIIDFLRRVEDPAITPRAVGWTGATLDVLEYPTLNATLTASVFAVLADPSPPEVPAPDQLDDEDGPVEDAGVDDESLEVEP